MQDTSHMISLNPHYESMVYKFYYFSFTGLENNWLETILEVKNTKELSGTSDFQADLYITNAGILFQSMVTSLGQVTQLAKWPGWDSHLVTTMPPGLCKIWHSIQSWGSTSNALRLLSWRRPCLPTDRHSQYAPQTQHPKTDLTSSPEFVKEYKKCIAKYSLKIRVKVCLPGLVLQRRRACALPQWTWLHFSVNKKRNHLTWYNLWDMRLKHWGSL